MLSILELLESPGHDGELLNAYIDQQLECSSHFDELPQFSEILQSNTDWQIRDRAIQVLELIAKPEAAFPLTQALELEDWRLRWSAATALGKCGNPDSINPLISAYQRLENQLFNPAGVLSGSASPASHQVDLERMSILETLFKLNTLESIRFIEQVATTDALVQAILFSERNLVSEGVLPQFNHWIVHIKTGKHWTHWRYGFLYGASTGCVSCAIAQADLTVSNSRKSWRTDSPLVFRPALRTEVQNFRFSGWSLERLRQLNCQVLDQTGNSTAL